MEHIDIGNLRCEIAKATSSDRICYILFGPLDYGWVSQAAADYDTTVVVISGMDWDNDLTPWAAPGAPTGSPDFRGLAPQFKRFLEEEVVPAVERHLGFSTPQRTLIGVSLSGLFALWQWVQSDMFANIGCISGSFWYQGFVKWLTDYAIPHKSGMAYLSLGKKEPYTPVPQFRSVGTDTAQVMEILQSRDINVTFQTTPGNHYAPVCPRLTWALNVLLLPKPD